MTKFKKSKMKVFDISTEKGIRRAENYQDELYTKYNVVNVKIISSSKVKVEGKND